MKFAWLPIAAAMLAVSFPTRVEAQLVDPPLPNVDWVQKLGDQVPMESTFTRADGREVTLDELVGERPVVLALVYYECPMLCNLVLSGLVSCFKGMNFDVGEEFDVIVLSIDPDETVELAADKRAGWIERYDRESAEEDAWHFLVGDEENILAVADAIGFQFSYVPSTGEYAHAAGISVLTPDGELSRIFYGTEYSPRDLQFGLIEASDGKVGSPMEKLILRCFSYDPLRGAYGFAVMTTLRFLSVGTVLAILGFIFVMLRRERRRVLEAA